MKRNGLFESHIFRAKRLFDLVFASLALLVTLPLFPLIALAIKATSKGNIIYVG